MCVWISPLLLVYWTNLRPHPTSRLLHGTVTRSVSIVCSRPSPRPGFLWPCPPLRSVWIFPVNPLSGNAVVMDPRIYLCPCRRGDDRFGHVTRSPRFTWYVEGRLFATRRLLPRLFVTVVDGILVWIKKATACFARRVHRGAEFVSHVVPVCSLRAPTHSSRSV